MTVVSAFAQQAPAVEVICLDPEPVTGESLSGAASVLRSPVDESIWIGLQDDGLLRIGRNGRHLRYTVAGGQLSSDRIRGLCMPSDGALYILDADGGLMAHSSVEGFRPVSSLGAKVAVMASSGAYVYLALESGRILRSSAFGRFEPFSELSFPCSVLTAGGDGSVYAASSRDGAVRRIGPSGEASALPSLPSAARCLMVDNNDVLWAVCAQSLYRLVSNKWAPVPAVEGLPSTRIESLLMGKGSEIWAATGHGIAALDVSETNVSISNVAYAVDEAFLRNSASRSRDDTLLFGTSNGVVLVSLSGEPAMTPWVPEPDPTGSPDHPRSLSWLLTLALAVLAFIIGWFLARRRALKEVPVPVTAPDPETEPVQNPFETAPVTPVTRRRTAPKPASSAEKPSGSALSGSELIALLERLEQEEHSEFAEQVLSGIRDSFSQADYSVEDLAASLGLSRVHLNRRLQSELGISPSVLLKTYRMRLASGMLSESTYTIAEIASSCGFSSSSYFSSAFRDYFGFPPSEYPPQAG